MARQISMVAQFPAVALLPAAADAAGRTSAWRSLRNAEKAWLVVEVNQGNAATVTLTPLQSRDIAGTGSKAIAIAPIFLNNDTSVSDAYVSLAAAALYVTDATLKDKYVIFEIMPESVLDVNNGFNHIALQTGASNAANITSAKLIIWGKYQQATPPTSYV
jgi:hypothetical protein